MDYYRLNLWLTPSGDTINLDLVERFAIVEGNGEFELMAHMVSGAVYVVGYCDERVAMEDFLKWLSTGEGPLAFDKGNYTANLLRAARRLSG